MGTTSFTSSIIRPRPPPTIPEGDTSATAEPIPDCPYRGLFPFRPEDANFFFGREIFLQKLIEATRTQNFIALLGASGSGKSSLVLAGLVPALQQMDNWIVAHFRPGSDPFQALSSALVPLYESDLSEVDRIEQVRKLTSDLQDSTVAITEVFKIIQSKHSNHRILLMADQFEEIYTLCPDEHTRRQFLDILLTHIQSPIVLIVTLRADFMSQALVYRPFAKVLLEGSLNLGPMTREELRLAITMPAQKLNVSFEAGLVERILADIADEPGNLSLLQFTLTELWMRGSGRRLTHQAYDEVGGVKGSLARYAEEVFTSLTPIEQSQARHIFTQLIRPGQGAEDMSRRATRDELGRDNWAVVIKLADVRLIQTSLDANGNETVEIVQALIQTWDRLGEWIEQDRTFRLWQERLRVGLQQWYSTNQDEGALLRGALLVEAQKWIIRYNDYLSQDEQTFIQASIQGSKQEKITVQPIAEVYIDEDQTEKLLRSALEIWQISGKDEEALLRAAFLIEAEKRLTERKGHLDQAIQDFILISLQVREQAFLKVIHTFDKSLEQIEAAIDRANLSLGNIAGGLKEEDELPDQINVEIQRIDQIRDSVQELDSVMAQFATSL